MSSSEASRRIRKNRNRIRLLLREAKRRKLPKKHANMIAREAIEILRDTRRAMRFTGRRSRRRLPGRAPNPRFLRA